METLLSPMTTKLATASNGKARRTERDTRACPCCGTTLTWRESLRWRGVYFDYYDLCPTCAGLVCYNRAESGFEVLISGAPTLPEEDTYPNRPTARVDGPVN